MKWPQARPGGQSCRSWKFIGSERSQKTALLQGFEISDHQTAAFQFPHDAPLPQLGEAAGGGFAGQAGEGGQLPIEALDKERSGSPCRVLVSGETRARVQNQLAGPWRDWGTVALSGRSTAVEIWELVAPPADPAHGYGRSES